MTVYEHELFTRLHDAWDPHNRVGMYSAKTEPLSDECKEAIVRLGQMAGLDVTFTVEPIACATGIIQQHFVIALRKKTP